MTKYSRRTVGIICLLLLSVGGIAFARRIYEQPEVRISAPPVQENREVESSSRSNVASSRAASVSSVKPRSVQIDVPFSPQAPFANWDPLHEEACEEMALIMVDRFWKGLSLSREQAEEELLNLVAWEQKKGYGEDINMAELAEIATEYFGLKANLVDNTSAASITRFLAEGKPVIVPAAGRDVRNPYFSGEGPWYHALVITGYRGNVFVTNDPGTRRGESYEYDQSTILSAIHDWTGKKEEIRSGKKTMLIIDGILASSASSR